MLKNKKLEKWSELLNKILNAEILELIFRTIYGLQNFRLWQCQLGKN